MGTCELFEINPMSKKLTKTLKHCNACFYIMKGLVNGFEFF
jgi:hypothetical protein